MSYSLNQGAILYAGNIITNGVPLGSLGCGNVMIGGTFQSDIDALQQLTKELYKDCPTENSVQDAVYPYDLDISSPHVQFHLIIWRLSSEETKQNFWNMVNLPKLAMDYGVISNRIDGKLTFSSRKYRSDFLKWWKSYTNRFYGGIAPMDTFLPRIRPGKLSGVFVEYRTSLDQLPYDYRVNSTYSTLINSLARGLLDSLTPWTWIVQNCKKPVFHHSGGWFFSNAAEGTKFALFNPIKPLP